MQVTSNDTSKKTKGCTIWFTGLPCSGKTTLALALCEHLEKFHACATYNIDGDILRAGLNKSLGFSNTDRSENIRRAAEVAKMMADAGLICVVSTISPFNEGRQHARSIHNKAGIKFFEIYLSTPLTICQSRDVKGLYKKAQNSEIKGFTGIDSVYETPTDHELQLDTTNLKVIECLTSIMDVISAERCLSTLTSYLKNHYVKDGKNGYPLKAGDTNECDEPNQENGLKLSPLNFRFSPHGKTCMQEFDGDTKQSRISPSIPTTTSTFNISKIDAQWVQTIKDGWAYPLTGFMRENEYLECLHFKTITRNKCQFSQSVPIILLCTDCDKKNLENATAIDLIYENEKIATLLDPEFYSFRKDEHCARLFGTTDFNHPTIQNIAKDGSWLIGGNLEDYKRPLWNDGLDHYRLNVKELRQQIELANNNVDSVVAFQVRNPLHNGHILLINEALNKLSEKGYINTIVLLHPLGGWTKDDDVPLDVRVKQHEVYLKELNWANKTVLAIFPSPMLYAGPVEVQWHAKARTQVGVTHYIVGRDPAGIPHSNGSDMYDPTHGGKVLSLVNHLLPLEFLSFPVAALCKSTRKMTFYDPKRKEDFEFISGTLMRSYARQKLNPPSGFMNNKAWNIIAEYYNSKL